MTKKNSWFTISGLSVTVGHTSLTRQIWDSYESPKSKQGRNAIALFAESEGFKINEDTDVIDAFAYLVKKFPGASFSWIVREALQKSQELLSSSDNPTT